jgi:transposase
MKNIKKLIQITVMVQHNLENYYSKFLNKINPSMKQVHLSGEKLFVDYSGVTIPIVNQRTGEITKSRNICSSSWSKWLYLCTCNIFSKTKRFILSHTLAYDFFGGTPLIVIVPDNLKSAVIKHSKKDGIVINESYAALAKTL